MSDQFLHDIALNPNNAAIVARWDRLALPNAWLVAGCLFQTVWNLQAGRAPESDIKDYDLFYYDDSDLSAEAEQQAQAHVAALVADLDITVEVANQARVHLWYADFFGHAYPPLTSAEDGIRRFLVLETCVAVRPNEVHAPYGLAGVYTGTLSPNPLTPYADLWARKVASYQRRWPNLRQSPHPSATPAPPKP